MAVTYRSEWVKCGKPGCGGCPHGPYWYAYWKESGKLHKKYIGKELPEEKGRAKAEPRKPDPWDAIFSDRTANVYVACEILGITLLTSYEDARSAYRKLAKEHHPDRGGDPRRSAQLGAAWGYLRSLHGWS